MDATSSPSGTRRTAGHAAGITAADVVRAAVELTAAQHLSSWSVRDLAARLGVTPSVIYHHVGGKDVVARWVAQTVVDDMAPPPDDAEWDDWVRSLLVELRRVLRPHPGVATWLLMHGPAFPGVLAIVDAGVRALRLAGFGDDSGLTYAALVNCGLMMIATSDDRLRHEDDGPRDHAAMMVELSQHASRSPGMVEVTRAVLGPMAENGPARDEAWDRYYEFVVEALIEGVRARLPASGA